MALTALASAGLAGACGRPGPRPGAEAPATPTTAEVATPEQSVVAARGPVRRVVVIGDSTAVLAAGDLRQRLAGQPFDVQIRAEGSGLTSDVAAMAAGLAAEGPVSQVIVDVGTTDVLRGVPAPTTVAAVGQIAANFALASCVHVVTVDGHGVDPRDRATAARVSELNDELRALPGTRPAVHLLDWDQQVGAYIQSGQPQGPLSAGPDRATDVGRAKLAEAFYLALLSCAGGSTPPGSAARA